MPPCGIGGSRDVAAFYFLIYIHYLAVKRKLSNLADMLGCQAVALSSTKQTVKYWCGAQLSKRNSHYGRPAVYLT